MSRPPGARRRSNVELAGSVETGRAPGCPPAVSRPIGRRQAEQAAV